ncbi:MAG: DUF2149 domain-containing protein [Nocardioides sp.]|uniref:DUF2149 domain-containing protein n=1 Tax=Nocardioides sp. TaxID=35761 RepID=UPI0039E527E0
MIRVSRRPSRREDRAGDPLDGLVNLFDLGIVLSLGFLLAALSSLKLADSITEHGLQQPANVIRVRPDQEVRQVPEDGSKVVGRGSQIGKVYRLDDGRLVYVVEKADQGAGDGSGE